MLRKTLLQPYFFLERSRFRAFNKVLELVESFIERGNSKFSSSFPLRFIFFLSAKSSYLGKITNNREQVNWGLKFNT